MSTLKFYEANIKMPGGARLPVRSTLVRLNQGQNLLISPILFNQEQLNELKQISNISIVAPNCFHHLFVKKTSLALGTQQLFAAPGLQQKRADILWTKTLSESTWPYQNELPMIFVSGSPRYNECVFFHKESRTLIVTDLLFNIQKLQPSFKNVIYKLMGIFNRTACSRMLKLLTKDRQALVKDLSRILELDFDRLVMAHGEIIETNAKKIFISALKERGLN